MLTHHQIVKKMCGSHVEIPQVLDEIHQHESSEPLGHNCDNKGTVIFLIVNIASPEWMIIFTHAYKDPIMNPTAEALPCPRVETHWLPTPGSQ